MEKNMTKAVKASKSKKTPKPKPTYTIQYQSRHGGYWCYSEANSCVRSTNRYEVFRTAKAQAKNRSPSLYRVIDSHGKVVFTTNGQVVGGHHPEFKPTLKPAVPAPTIHMGKEVNPSDNMPSASKTWDDASTGPFVVEVETSEGMMYGTGRAWKRSGNVDVEDGMTLGDVKREIVLYGASSSTYRILHQGTVVWQGYPKDCVSVTQPKPQNAAPKLPNTLWVFCRSYPNHIPTPLAYFATEAEAMAYYDKKLAEKIAACGYSVSRWYQAVDAE